MEPAAFGRPVFLCAGIVRMTTGCRSRSHPVEQQRVRAPIVVVPSTRPARLDATASTVRFLAQFGLCGAKNRQVAARNFGAADSLRRAGAAGCTNLTQPLRRRARTMPRVSRNAKNKAFFFCACSFRCSRCAFDARDGCPVTFRPRAGGARWSDENPPGVVDSGKNRD